MSNMTHSRLIDSGHNSHSVLLPFICYPLCNDSLGAWWFIPPRVCSFHSDVSLFYPLSFTLHFFLVCVVLKTLWGLVEPHFSQAQNRINHEPLCGCLHKSMFNCFLTFLKGDDHLILLSSHSIPACIGNSEVFPDRPPVRQGIQSYLLLQFTTSTVSHRSLQTFWLNIICREDEKWGISKMLKSPKWELGPKT